MTDGDVTQIEALKRTDIFDFFELLKIHEDKIEREIQRHNDLKSKFAAKNPRKKKQ